MARPRIHARPAVGQPYGRLTVIREAEPYEIPSQPGKSFPRWWCECSCGEAEPRIVRETHLTSGKITSCGCAHREIAAAVGKANKGKEKASGKLTSEQKRDVVTRYEAGESGDELGVAFGVSDVAVRKLLERRGVARRDLSTSHRYLALNEAAFSEVTEASAYWVGFLMADGNVYENGVKLALSETDICHIEAFRAFLEAEAAIKPCFTSGYGGKPTVSLTVWSERMARDLAKFGVVPKKSLSAKVIGLEHDRHFWRGAVDGDGWLGLTQGKYPALHMHGSCAMMEQFVAFVRSIYPSTTASVKPHKSIYRVALSGRAAREVIASLYSDASVALQRKAETARNSLELDRNRADLLDQVVT